MYRKKDLQDDTFEIRVLNCKELVRDSPLYTRK